MRQSPLVLTLLCLAGGSVRAAELAGIEFHGFLSQGYVTSSDNTWLAEGSEDGSFDLNEAALNASYNVTNNFRIAGQIYASNMWNSTQAVNSGGFDQQKSAKVNIDYLYGQYSFIDQFGLRAGRVKQAYGFYNEVRDVDAARSTAVLPQSVYDNRDREMNFLVTGVSGFGSVDLAKAGLVEWQAYYGRVNVPVDGPLAHQYAAPDVQFDETTCDAVVGGQLMWTTPIAGLRAGLSYRQTQGIQAKASIPAGTNLGFPLPFDVPLQADIDTIDAWLGSIEYIHDNLTLQAEYQRTRSTLNLTLSGPLAPALQPSLKPEEVASEGWYVLGSYRVHPQVEVGGVFSMYSYNWQDRKQEDWNAYQEDVGAFLRYDPFSWWTLKAEGHYVQGTGLLDKPDQTAGYFPPLTDTVVSTEYWTYVVARSTFSF